MKRQNTLQTKEQDKETSRKKISKTEINRNKEFKETVIKILTKHGRRMDELTENVSKEKILKIIRTEGNN